MPTLSAVIIAKNEEQNIARAVLSAISVTDEVLVIDTGSSDQTISAAKQAGARVLEHPFIGYGPTKNKANQCAKYDFILWLDADEELSKDAQDEVISWKENYKTPNDAAKLNRLNRYGNQWIKHGSWYPDAKVRIFHRATFEWNDSTVHERLVTKQSANIQHLKGDILHYAYTSGEQHRNKTMYYAGLAAQELKQNHKTIWFGKPLVSALFRFIKEYIFLFGFLDGKAGFEIAYTNALGVYWKYSFAQKSATI